MATNRHAQIRYNILDKCFSNYNRIYLYEDLLEEINKVLHELGTEGIQLRQLKYDIAYMESNEGWSIELDETLKVGRKRGLRYKDRSFSIANHPLNINDSEQLETTLAILTRYKHRKDFNWLEEFIPRMQQSFDLISKGDNGIISYQQNIDLKGVEYLGVLFNIIIKKKQINLIYQPYGKPHIEVIFNPYHLKQFNNRWFLFGMNPVYSSISNYPLDRIVTIEELSSSFEVSAINWIDYFDDIIGVTKPEDEQEVLIKLKFSPLRIQYVLTKPLHGTQKICKDDKDGLTISIEVIPNRELFALLLSFGDDVEVLYPNDIRERVIKTITNMQKKYINA